jgi:hypothetical protein
MEEKFGLEEAREEADKIREMVGPNPPREAYVSASRHLDMMRNLEGQDLEWDKRPPAEELKNFVVTQEMWDNALKFCDENMIELLKEAERWQPRGVSHRDPPFQVGCAVIGMGPLPRRMEDYDYIVWNSNNLTPVKRDPPAKGEEKRCAERNALDAAKVDCKVVFGIATSSIETSTGDPSKGERTLHPCLDCRNYFRELLKEGFIREDTRVFYGNNRGEKAKVDAGTVGEFLELYKDDL